MNINNQDQSEILVLVPFDLPAIHRLIESLLVHRQDDSGAVWDFHVTSLQEIIGTLTSGASVATVRIVRGSVLCREQINQASIVFAPCGSWQGEAQDFYLTGSAAIAHLPSIYGRPTAEFVCFILNEACTTRLEQLRSIHRALFSQVFALSARQLARA